MNEKRIYDIAIIGGGLAGLGLSIQLARAGYAVILFEKEQYPFHRVCGEYISFECWNFLESLGVPLSDSNLPIINKLMVTAVNGKKIEQQLPLGGFGISRFRIDADLASLAKASGVKVLENTKVNDVDFRHDLFRFQTTEKEYQSRVAIGSFGKRSNLDVKWNRDFTESKPNKLNNYIGVKYHIKTDFPADTIALHNFSDGYCGMSRIEDDRYCLCYLTTAANLSANNNSIQLMEQNVLQQNPYLKKIFSSAEFLFDRPVTIAQISFEQKSLVENHVLMLGDAAGMITPLCGNGMSMAMHSSKMAAHTITLFLSGKINRSEMEQVYVERWNRQFKKRLKTGRVIQSMFGKNVLTNLFISTLKPFPTFTRWLIRQTHGEPF